VHVLEDDDDSDDSTLWGQRYDDTLKRLPAQAIPPETDYAQLWTRQQKQARSTREQQCEQQQQQRDSTWRVNQSPMMIDDNPSFHQELLGVLREVKILAVLDHPNIWLLSGTTTTICGDAILVGRNDIPKDGWSIEKGFTECHYWPL
jgi:hypothetical protein